MDDFDAASERLLNWFKANGGEFRDDLLEIKDLRSRGAGRGIVAIKDIPKETVLFTVPRNLILSVETSALSRKIPNIFDGFDPGLETDEVPQPLDSWGQLILVMLYEYLHGDASKWKPYFDVLPTVFDTPIFWSQAELEELNGTCLTAEKIGKEESNKMLSGRILPLVQKHASAFYLEGVEPLQEAELLALAHRMGSTIMAYAFDLESDNDASEDEEDGWMEDRDGKTMLGMVPLADTLNADASFNAHVNHGDNLQVTALRSVVMAGSEILNYYGPLPSSELLRRYGYLSPEHLRYDVAELPWNSIRSALAKCLDIPQEILAKADKCFVEDELEEYFVIERESGDPDEEGRLCKEVSLAEVPRELEVQFKAYSKAIQKHAPQIMPVKRKRDEYYSVVVADALLSKLQTYSTTAAQDEELLLALSGRSLSKRQRMAIQVRLGEKILLQEALTSITGEHGLDHKYLYQVSKRARI